MDPELLLLVATALLVALAFLFVFATAHHRDADRALALGSRSSEAPGDVADAPSDRQLVPAGSPPVPRGSARDLERAVALERRRERAVPATTAPPSLPAVPPDDEALGVTRRQVLNRGIVTAMALALGGFGSSMLAMLWPTLSGGFGAKFRVGTMEEVLGQIREKKEPVYVGAGRFYVNPYPMEAVPAARKVTAYGAVVEGYAQGIVALYQKCPHLGCRVPWCTTSQWFECPCHGSQYNRVGEKKGGPAPRGMDRFVVNIEGGTIVVDTKSIVTGPPIGTNTTGQEAEGPHCIGAAAEK